MTKGPEMPEIEDKKVGSLYSKTDLLKVISEYFNDALPRIGYQEDHFWTNIRIILCIACCAFGVYAQFGTKFPQDRPTLALCVVGYFTFSGILAIIDYWVIVMSVMCIKINDESVFVDVNIAPFSDEVTLTLRSKEKKVNHKASAGHYFDSEGYLSQENLFGDFMALVKSYEKAKNGDGFETPEGILGFLGLAKSKTD